MNHSSIRRLSAAGVILLAAALTYARPQQPNTPLERRAAEVCKQFRNNPGDYAALFAPEFLAQIPSDQLTQIFTAYFAQAGKCTEAKLTKTQDQNSGEFSLIFEKGFTVASRLSVNPASPNLIVSLWVGNPISSSSSLNDVVTALKALPGETSFLVARLGSDSLTPVVAHNADSELAIGSAFKLYVLAELARELNANERKLSDVVWLDDKFRSLPSGTLQTWPVASPITLHSLAALMISISDNTAADHLLNLLGRERVERMVAETGHAKPALDVPFLSTLEMFKLKGEPTHKAADEFLALDAAGRRKFLGNQLAAVKREDARPYADGKPAYIDRIEWFASVSDLCRVMNWLRQHTETSQPAAPLRDVMAINTGLGASTPRERWSYIGFKGGSEPGVLNLTYLLRSVKGEWYAMSITWNNQQAAIDMNKVIPLVQRSLQIID